MKTRQSIVRPARRCVRWAWLPVTGLLLGLIPAGLCAQSAEDPGPGPVPVVTAFFDALGRLDFDRLATLVHPEALSLYRLHVTSIMDADQEGTFAGRVFGQSVGRTVEGISDQRVFAALVGAIYEDTPALLEVMATNAYEFLGHVAEGDTLAHVVARVTPYTTGSAPSRLTTVSVKRANSGWRVSTSPELDALTTAMRGLTFRDPPAADAQ